MSKTTFHSDPITGAVCAHTEGSPFRLFWLGRGTTNVYIGGCMNEGKRLFTRVTNSWYDHAETANAFKKLVLDFLRDAATQ